MQAFKKWCLKQLDELDLLESIYLELDDPGDTVEWIVQQAADRAAKLGLAELYRKSWDLKQSSLREARWFLSECLNAVEKNKFRPELLTVKQAAERLNVSQRTIYDIIENGQLRCQRIGKGRGTIRIKPTDLEVCFIEPAPQTYKHLTI